MTGADALRHAADLISGDREGAYGPAREDFGATGRMVTVLFERMGILAPGAVVDAHAVALVMVCVKLSREAHLPKEDNRVDGAGYFALAGDVLETK